MLLSVSALTFSTEAVIMMAMSGIFIVALSAIALFMFSYVKNSRKQMEALKRNVSALYVRQTQAATVKSDAPRVLHEKPDFRAMRLAQEAKERGETAEEALHDPDESTVVDQPAASDAKADHVSEALDSHSASADPSVAVSDNESVPVSVIPRKRTQSNLSDEALVTALHELIEKNLSNPDLSIAQLASELCMSRSGLFAKIKAATGDTPNNMISEARLTKARKLLEEGNRPINEIGYMVGYSTPSYFSRCFLKRYGMTPHAWMNRTRHQEG